jgi:hypothetical protein
MRELPGRLMAALADRNRVQREIGRGGMACAGLALTVSVAACVVSNAPPSPLAGSWIFTRSNQSIELSLSIAGEQVDGSGKARIGKVWLPLAVSGRFRPPVVVLNLKAPGLDPNEFTGVIEGDSIMHGVLRDTADTVTFRHVARHPK